MKLREKKKYLIVVAIVIVLIFAAFAGGCRMGQSSDRSSFGAEVTSGTTYDGGSILMSGARTASTADLAVASEDMAVWEEAETASYSGAASSQVEIGEESAATGRKLIKTYYITLETTSFDDTLDLIIGKAEALGGYVESSSESGTSIRYEGTSERYAYIVVKVPTDKVDGYLEEAENAGNVLHRQEQIEDITLKYTDTETYLEVLRAEQSRLIELIDEASTVEDLISLNARLTEVERQIESSTRQIRLYDNQIDYTSISFDINEVTVYSPEPDEGIISRMKRGIGDNFLSLVKGASDLAVGIVSFIPTLIVLIVLVLILILIAVKTRVFCRIKHMLISGMKTQKSDAPTKANASDESASGQNDPPSGNDS